MCNLDAYNESRRKKRASGTKHVVEDYYELFYNYYDLYNMQKEATLTAYKLYDKTKSNGTPAKIFADLKYNHKEDWERAKKDYFESIGVTEDSIIIRVNDIASNAHRPMVQLEALKFLYQILTTTKDSNIENKAQKLVIQFEESTYTGETDENKPSI